MILLLLLLLFGNLELHPFFFFFSNSHNDYQKRCNVGDKTIKCVLKKKKEKERDSLVVKRFVHGREKKKIVNIEVL